MSYWTEKYLKKEVDVVFCPVDMINAIKEMSDYLMRTRGINLRNSPFRSVYIEMETNRVSIDKQCL